MKINWSLRFHNKVWLTTLLAVVCTFVFNLLDLFGIETTVAQEQVMQLGAAEWPCRSRCRACLPSWRAAWC